MIVFKKKIYTVEGNIGAGKSTLLDVIKKYLPNIYIVPEPVYEWKHVGKCDLLSMFYGGPKRWCFTFEVYSMLTLLKKIKEAIASDAEIIFIERNILSNRAFHTVSEENGNLNAMESFILTEFYNFLKGEFPILNGVVYLETDIDTCMKRIQLRGREEESKITRKYLEKLEHRFKSINYKCKVKTIGGLYNLNKPENIIEEILELINNS